MSSPQNLEAKIVGKTDEQLLAMLSQPDDWLPESLAVARTELQRRKVDILEVVTDQAAPIEDQQTPNTTEVPSNLKTITAIGIVTGIILQIFGVAFGNHHESFLTVSAKVLGSILFVWGCKNYCVGKGYNKWLCLLGLWSCLGLLVLVILPDRRKEFDDHTS